MDLSDKEKWGTQIKELEKLPKFLQVSIWKFLIFTFIEGFVFGLSLTGSNYGFLTV